MKFLIEYKDKNGEKEISIENRITIEIIEKNKYIHSYELVSFEDLKKENDYSGHIPLGDILFVDKWLQTYKGIERQYPIEIPEILRTEEFLKRDYKYIKHEDIPKQGNYFLKDISQLKVFSFSGYMEHIAKDLLPAEHLYQLSENVDILAEYRVYIISGKIHSISQYDGNPGIFPDMTIINKANFIYSRMPDYPRSYTMDIMVAERGTSIIEIHPFNCVGFYTTLFGNELLDAYRDWLDYILKHNKQIKL